MWFFLGACRMQFYRELDIAYCTIEYYCFCMMSYRDPILDSINEGVFTVDLDWRVTSFNRAAEKITGIQQADAIGHRCSEVFRATGPVSASPKNQERTR